ncbi:MAG: glycosyltransferase family 4 protein [Kiritimatiellae bacterium]|nr:glycosyltransferase family 4 protein [Kiritimatiellia bacterium]
MRIGFFTSVEDWGGSEIYLKSLVLGVRQAGHEVVVFGVRDSQLWAELGDEGVPRVAWVRARRGQSPGLDSTPAARGLPPHGSHRRLHALLRAFVLRATPHECHLLAGNIREMIRLRALFRAHPVDVMHVAVHGYEVAGLACRWCGIPCLAMNMITPQIDPNRLRSFLIRHTMRAYDHVCSQSAFCTETWRALAGLPAERCSCVWNGVDVARFKPRPGVRPRSARDPFQMVSLGRLHPVKGYSHLIEALSLVGDPRARLQIFGVGKERQALSEQIERLRLGHAVQLAGYTERPEECLARAHCFVLPSVSHESGPAALAQAMACGLPLITSDFGPLAEINIDGETGLVVEAENSLQLSAAIRRLMDDPAQCARMGAAGRRRATELLSRERMISQTIALYRRLGAQHSRGEG